MTSITELSPTIAATVDHLGALRGTIADLTEILDSDKAVLICAAASTGLRAFDGALFRASVSFADKRKTDYAAVIEDLILDGGLVRERVEQLVRKHTQVAEGVPCVRVTARKER